MKKLIRNRCQCRQCGDIIESKHTHDWVGCKCGAIFTDGGKDYVRRGYKNKGDIIDLSEYQVKEDLLDKL
jgi:signal peptidase I